MNNATIHSFINYHFKSWQYFQPTRNATDNVNFKTPDDGIWYRLTVQHGINFMAGMAATPYTRELGAVAIQIFYPHNSRTEPVQRLADSLGGHFQYTRIRGLELLTASVVNIPEREDGYQINVRIPFRYDHVPLSESEKIALAVGPLLEKLVNEDLPSMAARL